MKGIIGRKVGMTQVFDETGEVIPVTVIEAGVEASIGSIENQSAVSEAANGMMLPSDTETLKA